MRVRKRKIVIKSKLWLCWVKETLTSGIKTKGLICSVVLHVWLWQTALSICRWEEATAVSVLETQSHRTSQSESFQHRSCPCAAESSAEDSGKTPAEEFTLFIHNRFHSTAFHLKVSNISTHPFVALWLVEHLLSVLQPGLQAGHRAAVFLPVADHFLQHAADAAHLHWQVLPLRCRIAQKLIHPFYLLSWRQITSWITCILNIEHLIFELHNP